jgi:hypothetical protein
VRQHVEAHQSVADPNGVGAVYSKTWRRARAVIDETAARGTHPRRKAM